MKKLLALCVAVAAVVMVTACGSGSGNAVAPTAASNPAASTATIPATSVSRVTESLLGTWTSSIAPSAALVRLSACSNIAMQVASQTATAFSGQLSMQCPDGVTAVGTLSGQLGGSVIPLSWVGIATLNGSHCPFSLTGTGVPMSADTFHIEMTGNTCFGPIQTSDDLRLGGSTTPTPTPTPTPVGRDMIDLRLATIRDSPQTLGSWPITTAITHVDMRSNGIAVRFSKQDGAGRWPDYTTPGWDGPLQYTLGMVQQIDGRYYASAPIQFWHGLERSGGPPSQYGMNWFYNSRWTPLRQPSVGDTIGIFVCAGNCRGNSDGSWSPVKERSNVVTVSMPDDRGALFTF